MRGAFAIVLAALLLFGAATSSGQDIIPSIREGSKDGLEFVDMSALGKGFDFYDADALVIQLKKNLPVWTVHNAFTSEYFDGETVDSMISARLFRYIQPETGINVLKGVIDDRSTGIIYDIKPDWLGRDTVKTIRPGDLPEDDESFEEEGFSLWDRVKSFDPYHLALKLMGRLGYPTVTMKTNVPIDLMVIWSKDADCIKSLLGPGCTLSNTTLANMAADVRAWVAETNTVFKNSNTGVKIKLVHDQRDTSGYSESGDASDFLSQLRSTNDGVLDYVHSLRNAYNADLVSFVMNTRKFNENICGKAYLAAESGSCGRMFDDARGFHISHAECTLGR